jgi:hypothetical protein
MGCGCGESGGRGVPPQLRSMTMPPPPVPYRPPRAAPTPLRPQSDAELLGGIRPETIKE